MTRIKRVAIAWVMATILMVLVTFPVQSQGQPQAEEHRLFLPAIIDAFTGLVELNCPPGTDATVTFETLAPYPGLIWGVWGLYDTDKQEAFTVVAFPYPIMDGYGAAVYDVNDPNIQVINLAWYSMVPLKITGSGCWYIEGLPIPPNAQTD